MWEGGQIMLRWTGNFLLSFFITLLVLLPLAWFFVLWGRWQNPPQPVWEEDTQVAIPQGTQETRRLLLVWAGEEPTFLLLRLDGPAGAITGAVVPGQTVVSTPAGSQTLRQSYQAAGPARAAALLGQTAGKDAPLYLAAGAQSWETLTVSFALDQGKGHDPLSFSRGMEEALALDGPEEAVEEERLWSAWLEQGDLTAFVPGVRQESSTLLTSLTAVDLNLLEDLVASLKDRSAPVTLTPLSGSWEGEDRFALDGEGAVLLQELLS